MDPPQLFPRRVVFDPVNNFLGFTVGAAGEFIHLCRGSPPVFGPLAARFLGDEILIVTSVAAESQAQRSGLLIGDRIAEINGRPMVAVAPNVLMAQAAKQKRLDFTVMHDPQLATVLVQNPPAVVARAAPSAASSASPPPPPPPPPPPASISAPPTANPPPPPPPPEQQFQSPPIHVAVPTSLPLAANNSSIQGSVGAGPAVVHTAQSGTHGMAPSGTGPRHRAQTMMAHTQPPSPQPSLQTVSYGWKHANCTSGARVLLMRQRREQLLREDLSTQPALRQEWSDLILALDVAFRNVLGLPDRPPEKRTATASTRARSATMATPAPGVSVPNSAFEQHVSRGNSGVDSASHVQTSHTERPARDLPSGETHHPGERPSKSDHESEVDTDDQTLEEENAELKERVKELWAALGLFKADRLTERLLEMKEKLSTARTERDEAVEQVERLKIKLKRRTEIAVDKVNELQAQVEASAAEVALLRSASGNHVPLTRSAIKTQEMITTAAEVGYGAGNAAFEYTNRGTDRNGLVKAIPGSGVPVSPDATTARTMEWIAATTNRARAYSNASQPESVRSAKSGASAQPKTVNRSRAYSNASQPESVRSAKSGASAQPKTTNRARAHSNASQPESVRSGFSTQPDTTSGASSAGDEWNSANNVRAHITQLVPKSTPPPPAHPTAELVDTGSASTVRAGSPLKSHSSAAGASAEATGHHGMRVASPALSAPMAGAVRLLPANVTLGMMRAASVKSSEGGSSDWDSESIAQTDDEGESRHRLNYSALGSSKASGTNLSAKKSTAPMVPPVSAHLSAKESTPASLSTPVSTAKPPTEKPLKSILKPTKPLPVAKPVVAAAKPPAPIMTSKPKPAIAAKNSKPSAAPGDTSVGPSDQWAILDVKMAELERSYVDDALKDWMDGNPGVTDPETNELWLLEKEEVLQEFREDIREPAEKSLRQRAGMAGA